MAIQWPQELAEEVINELAVDSDSLKACSLVCRSWVSRCRLHLFKTCGTLHSQNALGFGDLLRSPYCTFARHVRSIKSARYSWDANDSHFQEIAADLRRLTNVVELIMVTFFAHEDTTVGDSYFHTGFFTSFPQITQLRLEYGILQKDLVARAPSQLALPILDLICLFPALQELEITTGHDVVAEPRAGALPPQGLRTLAFGNKMMSPPILAWLHAAGCLRNVDSLRVYGSRGGAVVRTALQQIGGALRHLDVGLDSSLHGMCNFSLHPNLQTLVIRGWPGIGSVELMILVRQLAGLPLEHLSLELRITRSDFSLPELDEFLSPTRFPLLRSVKFMRKRGDKRHISRSQLGAGLPLLEASGMLQLIEF
ncbi:hypothetical protein K438DRAFT_1992336 [Mycena galopus ATCC 62051]|nr:hypothetical protein K438DRAFT_1992336 [Mycena galopus ATCC 62051]